MKLKIMPLFPMLFAVLSLNAAGLTETERQIPLIQDADVVVIGGTCGAVAAAQEAAIQGASVVLVTPGQALGEDVAGTLRVWADPREAESSALMRAIFARTNAVGGASSAKVYATPLQVKKALDSALLKAGVTFLTGAYATDVLRDEAGEAAGVVIANRSGRQAVRAKVLVDAGPRAEIAVGAGAKRTPFPAGEYEVSCVVIGDAPPDCGGRVVKHEQWKPDADVFQLSGRTKITPALFECVFKVKIADGSYAAWLEAENAARDRTFTTLQLEAADRLHFVAPCRIVSGAPAQKWMGASRADLACCRPEGVPHVYVLGPMADVPRDAAAILANPAEAIQLGMRIGRQAAREAGERPDIKKILLAGSETSGRVSDVREVRGTLTAPYAKELGNVGCGRRELPVLAETDLVVVGGGTTGAPAAVGAVRNGVKTLVVEMLYELGGVQTAGMICGYYYGNQRGFTSEIDKEVKATGRYRSQAKAEWYRRAVREGGGDVWFGCMAVGAVLEDRKMRGVVVATPDGRRGVVLCRAVIDATGNADMAAAAGEPVEFYRSEELIGQGVGMAVIRLGSGGHNNDYAFVDETDASDICFFGLRARQMTESGWDVSQLVNSRERRRLQGVVRLTVLDYLTARTFPDTIVQHRSRFDLHGWASHDFFQAKNIRSVNHVTMEANAPYRALLPKTTDGLLVAGIGMSADRDAMSILRMQPDLQNQGYAAAYAVYLALQKNCELRDIPVRTLQRHLVDKGVIPESLLTEEDSFPLSDSLLKMASHDVMFGYAGLQFLLAEPERSRPLLLEKYRELTTHSSGVDPEVRLVYAHVLAVLGEPTGEDELIEWVRANDWHHKWSEGLGSGANRMEAYLFALGKIRSSKAVPVIAGKINELAEGKKQNSASRCRVLALVCSMIGDASFAEPLSRLLRAPGVGGHSIKLEPEIVPVPGYDSRSNYSQKEKSDVPREVNLAAALYRLGDWKGEGAAVLKRYAEDPRGFYANYARRVLDGQ